MKPLRPDTFLLTLPDGKRVRCWRREADLIRADVLLTGNVLLREDTESGVYERIEQGSLEAMAMKPFTRRVGGA